MSRRSGPPPGRTGRRSLRGKADAGVGWYQTLGCRRQRSPKVGRPDPLRQSTLRPVTGRGGRMLDRVSSIDPSYSLRIIISFRRVCLGQPIARARLLQTTTAEPQTRLGTSQQRSAKARAAGGSVGLIRTRHRFSRAGVACLTDRSRQDAGGLPCPVSALSATGSRRRSRAVGARS